jgi:hypothetical protein
MVDGGKDSNQWEHQVLMNVAHDANALVIDVSWKS